jgi:hypothetical protein
METKIKPDQFSILRALRNQLDRIYGSGKDFDEITTHIFNKGKEQFIEKTGQISIDGMCLPLDLNVPNFRSDILAGTPTQGAEIVGEEKANLLEPLSNQSVLLRGGATFVTGLSANFSLPEYEGSAGSWADEVGEAPDGAGGFSDKKFKPHRITAVLNYSRLFLKQDSVAAEKVFYNDLIVACIARLEQTILSNDALVANVSPAGFLPDASDKFSGSAGVTFDQAVDLATSVQETKSWGIKCGYIVHPSLAGLLKKSDKGTATGRFIIEDGKLNGHHVFETGNMSKTLHTTSDEYGILFCNFAHIIITQYGGFDITMDPMTLSKEGKIRMIIHAYIDCKLRSSDALAFGSALLA